MKEASISRLARRLSPVISKSGKKSNSAEDIHAIPVRRNAWHIRTHGAISEESFFTNMNTRVTNTRKDKRVIIDFRPAFWKEVFIWTFMASDIFSQGDFVFVVSQEHNMLHFSCLINLEREEKEMPVREWLFKSAITSGNVSHHIESI